MTPRQAVWNRLTNDPSVSGLVGGRIYHVTPPQDAPLPLIVIDTVSNIDRRDLAGVAWVETRIQVTAMAASLADAERIALAVRASLNGFRGVMGDLEVIDARVVGYLPTYLPEVGQYHYAVDVMIRHKS